MFFSFHSAEIFESEFKKNTCIPVWLLMFKKMDGGLIKFCMLFIDIRGNKSKAKEKLNTITPPPPRLPLTTKIENNRKYILMFFHFILQKFLSQNLKKIHAYRYGYLCLKKWTGA